MIAGAAMIVGVMCIGAELAARHYERHRSTPPDYVPSIFYPHKRLRYGLIPNLDYYGWFKINSLGFRGREFSAKKKLGIVRVVCLGASTTFDIGSLGTDRPWPEVLEAELRHDLGIESIEVLNLGIPGATSLDSLIDLQMRAIAFQPDLVIVYQGHNDFNYSIPPPLHQKPSDLFPLEARPRSALTRWTTVHSLLYAKEEVRIADLVERLTRFSPFGAKPSPTSPRDRILGVEQGLSDYRANLRSIAAIARANGIALALPEIIFPFPPVEGNGRCRVCDDLSAAYGGLPLAQIRSTIDRYNKVLEQLGTEDHVYYIPTGGFVPSADRYYHESVHFSAEGSTRMGTRMAEALTLIVKQLTRGSDQSSTPTIKGRHTIS